MKKSRITRYAVLSASALLAGGLMLSKVQATPYASSVVANSSTVSFYINENGGNVVVTYNDGSTNANFNGITTGINVTAGKYSFSLTGHTTYSIAVTKTGTGAAALVQNPNQNTNLYAGTGVYGLYVTGDMRGVAVNNNPTSPYFGRIYLARSDNGLLWDFNSDGSFVPGTSTAAGTNSGVAWVSGNTSSAWRMSVAPDDSLIVCDFSTTGSAIWRIDPTLATNQLLLGPVGAANGFNAGVHASEESKPLILGNLASGATLVVIDGDFGDSSSAAIGNDTYSYSHDNAILVYSNLTYATLPWETAPNEWGASVGLSYLSGEYLANVYAGLTGNGNGYVYASQQRSGVSVGDPPFVQVYDYSFTNMVWSSRYNGGASDYFFTTAPGSSGESPCDIAVSPDSKYLATMSLDNHLTICELTNGIPDPSTIYTVVPSSFTGNGRGLCWDSADNIYNISSGEDQIQEWTLGQGTTATTIGTASGATFFGLTFLNTTINAYATNNTVISQANSYGNPTNGYFTLVRSGGNLSAPLTVNFTYGGTATNGTYTAGSTGTVVFAAGQTTTNILIKAVTDGQPRLTTYLTLNLAASASYGFVGLGQATISILNTATPYMTASAGAPTMYNAFSNDYASIVITRLGDTNTTETVNNFTTTGTATNGLDYTAPSAVTFNPGDLTKVSYIYPLVGGALPTHSPTQPYSGNKTVTLGVGSGSGYNAAPNTSTVTIVDSATPPTTVLYSDPLDDTTSMGDTANWTIAAANGNMANYPLDLDYAFGFDLTTAPYPIPFPPNGSQYALMMTVNKSSGQGGTSPSTAINAYLPGQTFSGNYAVRFSMNVIEPGDLTESGIFNDEEGPLFGINCSGMETNWWVDPENGFGTGAGETNFAAAGVFYWMSDSGGRYDDSTYGVYPYREFTGNGSPTTNSGWAEIATQGISPFANVFKTNVFTCFPSSLLPPPNGGWTEAGPGLPANGSGYYGLSDSSWSDVEIRQLNGIVSLLIDKTPIFTYTNTSMFTNGLLMLGYEDPWNGGESSDTAVYYSNLRVVAIGGPIIASAVADNVHQTTVITFSITDDDANTFKVYGSSTLTGTFVNIPSATVTSLGGGVFQAVVPQSGPTGFYRILQQ